MHPIMGFDVVVIQPLIALIFGILILIVPGCSTTWSRST
jgi:hypothetical protein